MLSAWLLLLVFGSTIYFKLIVPFFYWKRRDIFYVKPWTRFWKVFLSKESFAESVRASYDEYPDKRYYGSYQFLQPSLFVRDLDLIKQITVKDFEHFSDHSAFTSEKTDPILGLNLFSLKGQKWREMRSALSPAFTGSKMRSMFTLISETADGFTQHFLQRSDDVTVMEMKKVFTQYTNDVIANCAFGIKCNSLLDENNEFFTMGRNVSTPTPWRVIRSLLYGFFPKIFELFRIPALPSDFSDFFLAIIKNAIKLREAEEIVRPDMIHLLMEARKGRLKHEKTDSGDDAGFATVEESEIGKNQNYAIEITDEVITAQALVFFIAGFTTSSSLMSFLAYELAVAPQIQKKLQKEIDEVLEACQERISYEAVLKMKYLDQVVSESLRKYPPGYVLNRICVKDYVIKPKNSHEKIAIIEKGCLVAVPVMGIHYSPEFFPNPEKFDPDRFSDDNKSKIIPGTYMPFGMGPRNCIGSRFALLQMKVLLVSLLSKFNLVTVEKTLTPLKLAKSLGLEAKGGVWLGLQRRNFN
ncbi:cytochrome P450 9e2-like [Asbolus verrucosus]|uniref:Cytochrome P450 9e2-like n=1 Tax=Asbolus verrucosus TaxID=1661398 RepID=A0A482W9B0_ASBVE|nr:cytochrome P450 9e2-like [Asbolus verrucosus]